MYGNILWFFALAGGKNQIAELCKRLTAYGFGDCEIAVGERLSYPEERIFQGNVREFCEVGNRFARSFSNLESESRAA